MREMRRALKLRAKGYSARKAAESVEAGRTVVSDFFLRTDAAGLLWPLSEGMTDKELERAQFQRASGKARDGNSPLPD